ncbi:MAG TPA: Ig-like domain-containing protein, partial [Kofleriaceae bacterium]|nr:Ig-like domain-containing protein [Kofleriaceae bacterium]
MRLVNWRSLAIVAAGLGLAACGDDVVVANVGTLSASPTAVTCAPGTTAALGANLSPSSSGATFTYATSGVTPANAFTVTGSGSTATITCSNAGSGSVTITSGNQTITVPVTVSGQGGGGFNVIIAPSSQSVAVGGTATFSGTIIGSGTVPAVRFRSAQPNIATVDSITGVARGVAVGVATILASPAGSPANAAAATLTVLGPSQIVQSIAATPNPITLQTGQTQQLSATVNLQPNAPTNTARTVTYTSQNNAIATVSSTGLVTGVANGSTTINVRSTADTAIFQTVAVTVRAQTAVRITIANVTTENTNQLVDITQPIGTAAPNTGATGNNNTGSIFVTLNVDPGDATINRVDLFLAPAATPNDTTNRVCSQVFTAALADAYRLAMQNGSADVQPITCPINLAAFDTATGNPRIRNGTAVLRARVTGSFPGTTGTTAQAGQIAQFTQNLQINNQ